MPSDWPERLRHLRRVKGWSKRQLADALTVSVGTISNIEHGRTEEPHAHIRAGVAQLEVEVAVEEDAESAPRGVARAVNPLTHYHIETRPLSGGDDGPTLWECWVHQLEGDEFIVALGQGVGLTPELAYWAAMRALRVERHRSATAVLLATQKPP